jgi:phosphoserine phosphatase
VAFLASAFTTTFFVVQCINLMENLKLLLIDRLKSKGMDTALITAFLKALTSLISSEPGIEPVVANQKMHSLGWDEVTVDYHCLQIAIACLEADTK